MAENQSLSCLSSDLWFLLDTAHFSIIELTKYLLEHYNRTAEYQPPSPQCSYDKLACKTQHLTTILQARQNYESGWNIEHANP